MYKKRKTFLTSCLRDIKSYIPQNILSNEFIIFITDTNVYRLCLACVNRRKDALKRVMFFIYT